MMPTPDWREVLKGAAPREEHVQAASNARTLIFPKVGLTPKQARFVEEYPRDGNATQAAIRAGYSEKNVRWAAIAVLGWPHMGYVTTGQYHEKRDGIWRACTHPHGFDASGACFDCRDDWSIDND